MRYLLLAFVAIYIIGCAPSTAIPIDANIFVYMEGEAEEIDLDNRRSISLVTWNVLGLPDFAVATRPWNERIDGIVEMLIETDADLIVLQEVFEPEFAKSLCNKLKGHYAHAYIQLNTNLCKLSSGLAIFSKAPMSELNFTPHPNLLCAEKWLTLGMANFSLLDSKNRPRAHIIASHFQGSSRFSWRKGFTNEGNLRTYSQVRQEQSAAALKASSDLPSHIPCYLCGDLNVDRRDIEYKYSLLNPKNTPLHDPMSKNYKLMATSSTFFKHLKALWKNHPGIGQDELKNIGSSLLFLKDELSPKFNEPFWQTTIAEATLSDFEEQVQALRDQVNLQTDADQKAWKYFREKSHDAFQNEAKAFASDNSTGDVTLAEILQVCALPFDEALDYILGIGSSARISNVQILRGYDFFDPDKTLSDHHPIKATLSILKKP